jgi:fatty acid-binding protein DegV
VEIGIGHAICEEDALELERHLRRLLPAIEKLVVTGLGPGIGVHGGPGTLLVSVRPWVSAQDVARRAQ